ncbi:MAG: hypothetical protein U1F54_07260 [Burkholderiales bacterium]
MRRGFRLLRAFIASLLAIVAGGALAAESGRDPPLVLVDLATEYGDFYDRTTELDAAARVEAFKAHFGPRFPGFYDAARLAALTTPAGYDALIARSFSAFPELRPRYEATVAGFASMLGSARDSFVSEFPDFRPSGGLYLLHSVGEMDGGIRTIGGQRHLVFGADVMARIHEPGRARPFFHHELFHAYHAQFFPGCEAVWCALWAEGLAVFAGDTLNPGATDAELLLTLPRPIRQEVEARRREAVCTVRVRLDSSSPEDYAPLFTGRKSLDGLPPRFGYYVGYLAAREARRTRTLSELAHLDRSEARDVLDAALASLAECPG